VAPRIAPKLNPWRWKMKRLVGFKVYQEDALVIRWTNNAVTWEDRKNYSQGKRIPKAQLDRFPWAKEMIRTYVKSGTVEAIKFIKVKKPEIRILDAKLLLDSFRF
jgi:hypothetical protein